MNRISISPATIWITGITASGKTTLGKCLYAGLREKGLKKIEFLDGDELRRRLDKKYGHSLEDRFKVLYNIVRIVQECHAAGRSTIVSTISHKKEMREYVRGQIPKFMEVFLKCAPGVCADRDYKGHFKRAMAGEYDMFIGVTHSYEPSANPELILDTQKNSIAACCTELIEKALVFLQTDISIK